MSEHDPYFDIVEPRRRGRPRALEAGSSVSTWLTVADHDRLIKLAETRGESVSMTVKLLLQTQWSKPEGPR